LIVICGGGSRLRSTVQSEIWTHAFALAARETLVVVHFFLSGLDKVRRAEVGRYYCVLYARLYAEPTPKRHRHVMNW
jgi:hypothetical protein